LKEKLIKWKISVLIHSTLSKIERKINQMEDFGFNSTQSIDTQASGISANKLKINTVEILDNWNSL